MPGHTFDEWINCIFDHSVTDPPWYWSVDADLGVEPDEVNVEYLTRLFRDCEAVLRRFDNSQVKQGLWMIADGSCSDHADAIVWGDAPWSQRRACIRSIFDLYSKCFASRCNECLGSLPGCAENALNLICYMWWDVFPAWPDRENPVEAEEAREYIAVMERCLTLSHHACLEGALHGLGHWQRIFPERVEPIIDKFLHERSDLRPELIAYARRARDGNVQ